MRNFSITIVLCTWNRAEMLREALTSLSQVRVTDDFGAEILVVDNNSPDHTAKVVDEVAATSPIPIRRVLETQQGVVHARNRGVAEAAGDWIAFFDDDQLADENWLVELHAAAVSQNAKCVGGSVVLKLPESCDRELSPICQMLLGATAGRDTAREYDHRFTPGTGNLMLHRDVFAAIGVFDPAYHMRGEDTNLVLRALAAGLRSWFTPAAVVHHIIPAERLDDEFLLRLAGIMAEGMAEDERDAVGHRRYPLIWSARVAQYALLNLRYLWAGLCRNRERRLGLKCRLHMAKKVLADGWRLMWSRQPSQIEATVPQGEKVTAS